MDEHIHVHLADDTPPDKLLVLAKYCLGRAGVTVDEASAVLRKATGTLKRRAGRDPVAQPFDDPHLEHLWQGVEPWGATWWLQHAHLFEHLISQPDSLDKAWDTSYWWPWTRAQWARVVSTLRRGGQAFVAHVTGQAPLVTLPDLSTLIQAGALPDPMRDVVGQAVRQGILNQLPPALPVSTPGTTPPLSSAEQLALDFARRHAGANLQPLVSGVEARIASQLLHRERQAVARVTRGALADRTPPASLASLLADDMQSWQRDWRRVARTELANAHNWGAVSSLIAHHPTNLVVQPDGSATPSPTPVTPDVQVFKVPASTACDQCAAIWLMPDGAPRLYALKDILANPPNIGLPQAQWTAQVGPIHPNCVCSNLLEYTPLHDALFTTMRQRALAQRTP